MLEEMDRVILNLIEFGILDKLFKDYDFTTPNEGIFIKNSYMVLKGYDIAEPNFFQMLTKLFYRKKSLKSIK